MTTTTEEDAARTQAEARRQRILEAANQRMNVVSGDTAATASKGAARARAARQRMRQKKKATTTEETKQQEEASPASAVPPEPETKAVVEEDKQQEPKEANDATPTSESNDNQDSKKYVGVAKMRRKMLLEKKKTEEAKPSENVAELPTPPKLDRKVPVLPIIMSILTALLLFLVGLDVGAQVFQEDVLLHHQHVVHQHGIPLLTRPMKVGGNKVQEEILVSEEDTPVGDDADGAEFDEMATPEPELDPIFGVDLDKLTEGPGLFNMLARLAVAAHRVLLKFLYYMPLSLVQRLAALPAIFLETPPILCIIALILRQIVGKKILGADIPNIDETASGKKKDSSSIDLVAAAKSGVSSFLSNTFPTAVAMYDAFSHLRSDMYVVMCGVFCGLVWTYMGAAGQVSSTQATGTDEL